MFVVTKYIYIVATKVLSQQIFVVTNVDMHTFIATKDVFCRGKKKFRHDKNDTCPCFGS